MPNLPCLLGQIRQDFGTQFEHSKEVKSHIWLVKGCQGEARKIGHAVGCSKICDQQLSGANFAEWTESWGQTNAGPAKE